MIVEIYENPNKPVPKWQSTWTGPTNVTRPNHTQMEEYWAKKKNITVEEYKRRDDIVRTEYAKCRYFVGGLVWPYSHALCEKMGQYRIRGIYKAYHEFETNEWDKSDNAYCVTAERVNVPETIFTTIGYFQQHRPLNPKAPDAVLLPAPAGNPPVDFPTSENPPTP